MIKSDNGTKPSIALIKDGISLKAKICINRIPIKDIPVDDENKCSEFLYKLYEKKVSLRKLINKMMLLFFLNKINFSHKKDKINYH